MGDPLQEAPLPRYRLQRSTGRWRKEAPHVVGEATVLSCATEVKPFESSYDYFLRCSYAVEKKVPTAALQEKQRKDMWTHIEKFQLRHLNCSDAANAKRTSQEDLSSSDEEGTSDTRRLHSSRRDDGIDSAAAGLTGTRDGRRLQLREVVNPLMGYLAGVPLSDVYAVLVAVKGVVFPRDTTEAAAAVSPHSEDRMNVDEFQQFLSLVGDVSIVDAAYRLSMMSALPSFSATKRSVATFDLFSYIVEHSYHPRLVLNVEMLFRAFDVESRGTIPIEALHSRVVTAWAEVNTFGNLRDQWLRFAATLETEENSGVSLLSGLACVDRRVIRAALCASAQLYSAAASLNLEGGKKVPILPPKRDTPE